MNEKEMNSMRTYPCLVYSHGLVIVSPSQHFQIENHKIVHILLHSDRMGLVEPGQNIKSAYADLAILWSAKGVTDGQGNPPQALELLVQ